MSNHLINRACQTWPTPTQVQKVAIPLIYIVSPEALLQLMNPFFLGIIYVEPVSINLSLQRVRKRYEHVMLTSGKTILRNLESIRESQSCSGIMHCQFRKPHLLVLSVVDECRRYRNMRRPPILLHLSLQTKWL